jgi:Domain of unknown function (DUF1937).
MKLIYLASPYLYRGHMEGITEYDRERIQEQRYQDALDATAYLMNMGYAVYSPIVSTHPVAVKHKLPLGSEYWIKFDEIILRRCTEICVLTIDGWKESPGVQREIRIAMEIGMTISYLVWQEEKIK